MHRRNRHVNVQAELERLKRQHADREAQKQAERVAASAAASFPGRAAPADTPLPAQGPPQMTDELKRTLKVCSAKDPPETPDPARTHSIPHYSRVSMPLKVGHPMLIAQPYHL